MRPLQGILRRWSSIAIGLIVLIAIALGVLVQWKADDDLNIALKDFQSNSMEQTRYVKKTLEENLSEIHHGLRTISALPSVKNISRYAENLDRDDRLAINLLYEHMHSAVEISEIYITPADFNPERLDPKTGALQAPIIMFDGLISQDHDEAAGAGHEDLGEVEIFEYRAIAEQLKWLQKRAPHTDDPLNAKAPLLSSDEVITCDNTVYQRTKKDSDRAGIILSVPFYGDDGTLKGVISVIVRTAVLRSYLPDQNFALLTPSRDLTIFSAQDGQQNISKPQIAIARPDMSLVYSEVLPLNVSSGKGRWRIWSGFPNEAFTASAAVSRVTDFRNFAIGLLIVINVFAVIGVLVVRHFQVQEQARKDLEIHAERESNAKRVAEDSSTAKSQFLATMSHELRTPLNAIINYSDMIAEDAEADGNAPLRDDAKKIWRAGKHLLQLISDVLNFSKIEAGQIDLEIEEFDVSELVSEVEDLMRGSAEANNVQFEVLAADGIGFARSDALKLKQCLLNLLSNAVKFSEGGRVKLTATRVQVIDERSGLVAPPAGSFGHDVLQFEVRDSGIGMSPAQVAKLFQPFKQADASITRKFGGTGLGLSITRSIATALGGDVAVASELGKGSTFTLWVRTDLAPEPHAEDDGSETHIAA